MKKRWKALFFAVIAAAVFSGQALADDPVAWGSTQEQTLVFYLLGEDSGEEISCQVGNTKAEISKKLQLNQLETPLETVILVDNSSSVSKNERDVVEELLNDLVANRMQGETYTIATISDELTYLCERQGDYTLLKAALDELEYHNQETHLTDGFYRLLKDLEQSDEGLLRRIVLIADGVDNKQIGYTPEELNQLIQELDYPIYTVGCKNTSRDGNEQLENLFALSRLTSGSAHYLPETQDPMVIVSEIMAWNDALYVEAGLPNDVCDGSKKMVKVTGGIGAEQRVYVLELTMPFADLSIQALSPAPRATPEPTPVPAAPEPAPKSNQRLWVLLVIAVVVAGAVAVVILMVRKGKKEADFAPISPEDRALVASMDVTEMADDGDNTAMAWDPVPSRMLILRDAADPTRRLEAPLRGTISVGRDSATCQLVIAFDPSVSRHQCDIYVRDDGQLMLRNRSKSNITKVNSAKVSDECEIENGSVLRMGYVEMHVEIR